jgi:hypothetical protein
LTDGIGLIRSMASFPFNFRGQQGPLHGGKLQLFRHS